jgi:hypothetical protein
MKTLSKILTGLITIVMLSACTVNQTTGSGTAAITQTGGTTETGNVLPEAARLIVGTLKLDGTENAISANQAKDLLFLWQGYKELSTRDSAAPEEKSAILSQVKDLMTEDQLNAITAMNLTARDVMDMVQSIGTTASTTSSDSSNSNRPSVTFSGPPGGGPGGGGFMFQMSGDGGGMPPDAVRMNASQSNDSGIVQTRIDLMAAMADNLLDPLITMLQKVKSG